MIDTHCHLTEKDLEGRLDEVIGEARAVGVTRLISCGTNLETSRKAVELSRKHPGVYATVGIHPEEATIPGVTQVIGELEKLVGEQGVVAVGEIGLDWWRMDSDQRENRETVRRLQLELFELQMELAARAMLPVVIHDREAHEEVIEQLKRYRDRVVGVMHCFSGTVEMAREVVDLGYYISFAGNVTYKKNEWLREVAKIVPDERLLLETDAPYLPPEGRRGEWPNRPVNVMVSLECLAKVRGVASEELGSMIGQNAKRLFGKII